MFSRPTVILIAFAFLGTQTKISLTAQEVERPQDVDSDGVVNSHNFNKSANSSGNGPRQEKQIADADQIDVDGPYGYVPRVVHGVRKIVKGILNGSVHQIMHGAFGIAPEEVADDLVGTYNRIMGIPDPEDADLDLDETTEKTKRPPASKEKAKATTAAATEKEKDVTLAPGIKNRKKPIKYLGSKKVAGNVKAPAKTEEPAESVESPDPDDEEENDLTIEEEK